MVRRGEITDQAWQEIEPLLPEYGQSGGQWRDHRTVINGILWKLRTGSPWRALARPARKVRLLADLLRPLQSLEARWHLGSLADPRPDQERRGRRG
jgi:transposase